MSLLILVEEQLRKKVNSNNQTVCREDNNIESDEEEVNPYSYYSGEESDDNPELTETLRQVNKILTPTKPKKQKNVEISEANENQEWNEEAVNKSLYDIERTS